MSPLNVDEAVPLQQAHHRTIDSDGGDGYGSNASIPPMPPSTDNDTDVRRKQRQRTRYADDIDDIDDDDSNSDFDDVRPGIRSHEKARLVLIKTQESFWKDAYNFAPGSIPHSMVLALTIGTVCGIAAYIYYAALEWSLEFLWTTLPNQVVVGHWPEHLHFLWIPLIGFPMAACLGLTVVYMGEPGDLPYTVKCVHEKAYVSMDHVMPMVVASQFSILAGGSLGPEAPLVAICAALGGFISRSVFGMTNRNLVRKHTLMGMAGALAAFFGCPLGGSLFAMEVNSRFGIEYFEHTLEAIMCGEVCLAVFRTLADLPIQPIWEITNMKLPYSSPLEICQGAALGVAGAGVAWCFAQFHFAVMSTAGKWKLLQNENAVYRGLAGATVVCLMGMLIPQTMFWGEFEFQTIATMGPTSELPHIWPQKGMFDFQMTGFWTALTVGVAKLIAISFTVGGGFRGGYIFPAFAAGAALGQAIHFLVPFVPVQICVLCMAAAINVALTRTAIATTLILAYLAGEPNAISAILAASLVSLFLTGYMPFIRSQMVRADLESCMYYSEDYSDIGIIPLDDVTNIWTPFTAMRKAIQEELAKDKAEEAVEVVV
jgi:H+/Cl- antiporter ClcA